jgi:glycosyltransferase involved in cell wall biosynthesis
VNITKSRRAGARFRGGLEEDAGMPDLEPLPISVVVLTFNEERNIEECLRSVREWAGEIFVLDSGSTDGTLEIVRRYTSHVASHPFENYARQRNWAQENLPLTHDWVFHLDADERVTPELADSIRRFFRDGNDRRYQGAIITRRTVFLGRPIWHGGHYPAWHLRLFRRSSGRCEDRKYDQHYLVEGPTAKLSGDLIDVLMTDLTVWMVRHAKWGACEAEQLESDEAQQDLVRGRLRGNAIERRRWWKSSVYARAPLGWRAFAYFLYRYFFRLGFMDGYEGLIFHFLHGCCYRFYVDAKIYEYRKLRRGQST